MKTRKLIELCEMRPAKAEARSRLSERDAVSFLPMSDLGELEKDCFGKQERTLSEVEGSYTYFAEGDVLLAKITPCFENGKLGIARGLTNGAGFGSSQYFVLRAGPLLDAEFLYYFLAQDWVRERGAAAMVGAVGHKRVPKEFIENLDVPVLSLSEQKRIVAVLDGAFEGLRIATANAEKNLSLAETLAAAKWISMLETCGAGWSRLRIDQCFKVKSGDFLPAKEMASDGTFPVYGGNGVAGTHDAWNVEGSNIVIGRVGAKCGNVHLVDGRAWITDNALLVSELLRPLHLPFLAWALSQSKLRSYANQMAQPVISFKTIREVELLLPEALEAQVEAHQSISTIGDDAGRLMDASQRKLALLTGLRQSILSRAFSGQLTATKGLAA